METRLPDALMATHAGREADAILRACVHCGFCTATCPTYQLLGDELDGPRGRIYLVKEALEGAPVTHLTQLHLDRCLSCRACETTCPSGVRYGRLLDIGRDHIEAQVPRTAWQRAQRYVLVAIFSRRVLFGLLLTSGRFVRPFLPREWQQRIPRASLTPEWPTTRHTRRMLVLQGCVQAAAAPSINAAAARVLDRLGISLISASDGCCGAMAHHLTQIERAREQIRRNIDAWWPHIERGVEAIIVTASGCGTMVQQYGELLHDDPRYAAKARRVSELFCDLSTAIARQVSSLPAVGEGRRVAFQSPCSLHHGLKIRGAVERVLTEAGYVLTSVDDAHLCCGSAGAYSLLQSDISQSLKERKLAALQVSRPEIIATANIGCLLHLQSGTSISVRHWIELLDQPDSRCLGGESLA